MQINQNLFNFVGLTFFGAGLGIFMLLKTKAKRNVDHKHVVVISGSNSGLGYNMAVRCAELGMTVVAACYDVNSIGAKQLLQLFNENKHFHVTQLDVTNPDSVFVLYKYVNDLLENNPGLEFSTLVNNCGVMCFGETEWQTHSLIEKQIQVNLLGTIRLTKEFLPLVRRSKGRIINVTSHCGLRALPALPIYGATKAGLISFNDCLRLDMEKYGVQVINFVPGSFVGSSNIAARQNEFAEEMKQHFSPEQLSFYGEYFNTFNGYLSMLSGVKPPSILPEKQIIETFEKALLDKHPKTIYKAEPWRYTMYHALFKIAPQPVCDWLIHRFVAFPKYTGNNDHKGFSRILGLFRTIRK